MSPNYDVFVSYAREDLQHVRPWAEEFKQGGVSVFFDMESLLGGSKWQGEIAEAIHSAKLVILFVSRSSVVSEFVPKELALAVEMKKNILPVFLEETEVRGQMAFCIAGLQRVQVHDSKVGIRQHLLIMQPKLREFGVNWVNPTQFLNGVRQGLRRDVGEAPSSGNVRVSREPEPRSEPAVESGGRPTSSGRAWLLGWLVLMATAVAVIVFYWTGGLTWLASASQVVPDPAPPVPKALPLTLEEEAQDFANRYYLAANQDPVRQVALLADEVDYLGHPRWKPADVQADLQAYAQRWAHQQFEVLAKSPTARVIEPGRVVECEVPLRYTSRNAVVTASATFTGRLRMQLFGEKLRITSVTEVPGSRRSEPLKFDPEGQKKAVMDFITRAVLSGSSSSGMKPEDIAAMYVEKPDYFGRTATREEIVKETQTLITRWEEREYRVKEGPQIMGGIGTPNVEVKVGLDYRVFSPSRGGKTSQGRVSSVYLVHFSAEGEPLIQKHAEVDRGQ